MKDKENSTFLSVYLIVFLALALFTLVLVGYPVIKKNILSSDALKLKNAFLSRDTSETTIALYDRSGSVAFVKATTEEMDVSQTHTALKALFEIKGNVGNYKNYIPRNWRFEGFTLDNGTAYIRVNEEALKDKAKPVFKNAVTQIKTTVVSINPEVKKFYLVMGDNYLDIGDDYPL